MIPKLPERLPDFKIDCIAACADYVQNKQHGDPGHDWLHIERVWDLAKTIALKEECPSYIVQLAALTHDLDDRKFSERGGYHNLERALSIAQVPPVDIAHVKHIVRQVSWSTGAPVPDSLDARIVQDADRLDAIGAIGIARAFSYGGYKGRPLYEEIAVGNHTGFADSGPSTLAHFAEKLLHIAGSLHTPTARAIGVDRDAYLRSFVKQFTAEVNGKR